MADSMVSIQTPRLLLRLPELSDAQPFMEIHQDPEVLARKQVTLTQPPGGLDLAVRNVERMLSHWTRRGYGQWAVVENTTGQTIGCVGFFNPDGWPGIDLGWVFHRSRWGNGFATEAAGSSLKWAWDTGKIEHVISLISPDDLRSIRVATKIGERFERADVDPINGEKVHVYGIHRVFRNDSGLRTPGTL